MSLDRSSSRRGLAPLATIGLLALGCGEGLPDVPLKLSKNCNQIEVDVLVPRVGDGDALEVLDVAANGTLGDTAWVLVRRASPAGAMELVVQRVAEQGVEHETVLPVEPTASLSLSPAPETGRVWVVRDEPSRYELWRVAPDDPVRPLLGSTDLSSFPSESCLGCEEDGWPRRLFHLPNGPAIVALPRSSDDATLVVWVGELDTSAAEIRLRAENRLNFELPCDDSTPESALLCEEQQMSLRYPVISLLGIQQDPRQSSTTLFAHRTRNVSYDGDPFPIDTADVLMVSLHLDHMGDPAGLLRSYAGFHTEYGGIADVSPYPSADPPYGVAIDRFASYGLFSNDGKLARIVQLPELDPEFVELTGRVPLELDTMLLQLDRDIALGRLVDGAWELTKLFPDDPAQSGVLLYETDASIEQVISGGVGTFMLRKRDAPPEVVRLRCPEPDAD